MRDDSISIDAKSLASVLAKLERLPQELQKSAERAVLRGGGNHILQEVRQRVPVDSGTLKKSLGVSVNLGTNRGGKWGEARIGARSGVKYRYQTKTGRRARNKKGKPAQAEEIAWYLEMGNSRQSARPFIRPSLDSAANGVSAEMVATLEKHLTKVAAKMARQR